MIEADDVMCESNCVWRSGRVVGPTAKAELVTISNSTGLELDGAVFIPDLPSAVVVHVHGSLGNFYHQQFLRLLAPELEYRGIALLSFNLTGHDGISEGYSEGGEMEYVGGSLSSFDACLDDLDGIISYATSVSPHIVLQGHSLGCDRVLYFAEKRRSTLPLVLLSPCDSHRLHQQWLGDESIDAQIERLESLPASETKTSLLHSSEYGVRGTDGWTYEIPINRDALLSIIRDAGFRILRVRDNPTRITEAPAFVYLGRKDQIRGVSLDLMREHIRGLLPSAKFQVHDSGDHNLAGCERAVSIQIADWILGVFGSNRTTTEG